MVDSPLASLRGWMLQNDRALAMFYEIPDGVEVPEHAHGAQWGVVLEGSIEFTIGGETRTYRRGDTYYVPDVGRRTAPSSRPGYVGIDVFADADRYQAAKAPRRARLRRRAACCPSSAARGRTRRRGRRGRRRRARRRGRAAASGRAPRARTRPTASAVALRLEAGRQGHRRSDREHADPVGAELDRERLREPAHAELRRDVVRGAGRVGAEGGRRGDVDDHAAACPRRPSRAPPRARRGTCRAGWCRARRPSRRRRARAAATWGRRRRRSPRRRAVRARRRPLGERPHRRRLADVDVRPRLPEARAPPPSRGPRPRRGRRRRPSRRPRRAGRSRRVRFRARRP